jgi:Secretion system C-terminal sorting domain
LSPRPDLPMSLKSISFICSILLCLSSLDAQVIIGSTNLPNADDTLITQPATLLVDVDLQISGPDQYWDFGPEVLAIQPISNALPCFDVNDTPLAYQFLFNNPFLYPTHNSDYGLGVEAFNLATVTFEDTYMYYKNSGGVFSITGMGASINGIPLAAQKNEPELIFNTPLDYLDADSSYSEMEFTVPGFGFYGQTIDRSYFCDGWGTLSIGGTNFEALRVRTEIMGSDSLFSETFGFGLTLPRPLTVEYAWYSPDYSVPILQITTTEGIVSAVATAPLQLPSNVKELQPQSLVYPNPANTHFTLSNPLHQYVVYNQLGQVILETNPQVNQVIYCTAWTEGLYFLHDLNIGTFDKIVVAH